MCIRDRALDASRDVESIYKTVYKSDGSPVYLIDKISDGAASDEDVYKRQEEYKRNKSACGKTDYFEKRQ